MNSPLKHPTVRRGIARLVPVILLAAGPAFAQPGGAAGQSVERQIKLPDAKSGAIFALLAPQRVRVLVTKTADGVTVRGTQAEVEAVEAFAKLLTRDEGKNYAADPAALAKLQGTWDSQETYDLPQDATAHLYAALAFNDVPVIVENAAGGVQVQASKADQETVGRMVKIVKGEELLAAKPEADKPQVAKPEKPKKPEKPAKPDKPQTPSAGHGGDDARVSALERRIEELEKRLAALEGEQVSPAEEPTDRPGSGPRSAQMIDRRYRLPEPHLSNLYQLFAPSDIGSVVVGRDGNQLRIRATPKDQKTIERLVELLTRGGAPAEDAQADMSAGGGA